VQYGTIAKLAAIGISDAYGQSSEEALVKIKELNQTENEIIHNKVKLRILKQI
jgi:putative IMPACT (imprinted ancient) family translation regulator